MNPVFSSNFADFVDLMGVCVGLSKQFMSALDTEMRDVDNRRRVIGQHRQDSTFFKRFKPFAGFEHGQWAQQPQGVEGQIVTHVLRYGAAVTACPLSCE